MWFTRFKPVRSRVEDKPSRCKVCKQETAKTFITEKEVLVIGWIIPVRRGESHYEICSGCKSRMRVNADPNLIDS